MVIGTVISRLRRQKGLSQAHLADAVGVNQSTLSRIETGQSSLSVDQLGLAADALGVDASRILEWADEAAFDLRKRGIRVERERAGAPVGDGLVLIALAAIVVVVIAVLASKARKAR